MRFSSSVRAVRVVAGGLLGVAATLGGIGLVLVGSSVAAAGTGVDEALTCALPFSLGSATLSVVDTMTVPATVAAGSSVSVGQALAITIPSSLVKASNAFGASEFNTTKFSVSIGSSAGPDEGGSSAVGLPVKGTIPVLETSPETINMATASISIPASATGTIAFYPTALVFTAEIVGGQLDGQSFTLTCSQHGTPVPAASATVGAVTATTGTTEAVTVPVSTGGGTPSSTTKSAVSPSSSRGSSGGSNTTLIVILMVLLILSVGEAWVLQDVHRKRLMRLRGGDPFGSTVDHVAESGELIEPGQPGALTP